MCANLSQIYAQDCLAGLIGDLQTLPANIHLLETSLAQNLINDLQNSGAGTVDVVEEQSFIVDDSTSRLGSSPYSRELLSRKG